jgi:ABC-type Mn2+/Zn2+ transport system permease subunit
MFSLTQAGNLTAIAGILGSILDIPATEIETIVASLVTVIGILLSWYGRFRKGDITILGFRK